MTLTPKDSPYHRDLRKIHGGARELGIDNDLLHDILRGICNKDSLTKTTATERGRLIRELERRGAYQYRSAKRGARSAEGKGTDTITGDQQDKIEGLWEELAAAGVENARVLKWRAAFCRRILGKPWPQKVWEGQKLIEALKKRVEQGASSA